MIKIATRKSPMALAQTQKVALKLTELYPDLSIDFLPLTTKGDQIQDRSLAQIGGKGLFIKALEEAILAQKADIAVHSLKDVPPILPSEFIITAVLPRLSAYDVLVSRHGTLDTLPKGAVIGTSSVRRQAELLHYRSDLTIKMIRGNVNTRLAKLDASEYDALILGEAGLIHIGFADRITEVLAPKHFLPSVGQGVIAIEVLKTRQDLIELFEPLNDPNTFTCITAERSMNENLGASCTSPVGSFAEIQDGTLKLRSAVFSHDGQIKLTTEQQGSITDAVKMGHEAAKALLAQGAGRLL